MTKFNFVVLQKSRGSSLRAKKPAEILKDYGINLISWPRPVIHNADIWTHSKAALGLTPATHQFDTYPVSRASRRKRL